jgi:hypothetical protein
VVGLAIVDVDSTTEALLYVLACAFQFQYTYNISAIQLYNTVLLRFFMLGLGRRGSSPALPSTR